MNCPFSCYCGLVCSCELNPQHPEEQIPSPLVTRREYPNNTVYVLLLGAAETGKSTMMRQMKIIHNGGMSPASLRSYAKYILDNVLKCVHKLILAVQKDAAWTSPEAINAAYVLRKVTSIDWGLDEDNMRPTLIPQEHARLVQILWEDGASQECWQRANEYNLPDNTAYYLDAIKRLAEQPYMPRQEDVLQLRLPTTSATVYDFVEKNWNFRITDVGGQRGERRRWLRLFDNINAIIFLAALSDYDQNWSEEEEEGMNRLELSLQLFREVLMYPGFSQTCMILFLNKTDVLRKKIMTSDLSRYFPSYSGPRGDANSAIMYIQSLFVNIARETNHADRFYIHETCATDTKAIKFVFSAVRNTILEERLRDLSLYP